MKRKIKLLLVDDHAIVRQGLVSILEFQPDFKVVGEAEDGAEAIRKAKETDPDVSIMDIMMPNLNGLDAARRIRALPREDARRVPILAMSANAYQEDKEMSMEAGMNAHIAKPFDKDETLRLAADFALRYRHP